MTSELEGLIGGFDFAKALAAKEEDHRANLRALLIPLLEVMDSFDRLFAFLEGKPVPEYLETVRLIARQLERVLNGAGATPVGSLGKAAEPGKHEILDVRDAAGVEEGLIVEEVERAYEWDGELLRKARVIVAGDPVKFRKES